MKDKVNLKLSTKKEQRVKIHSLGSILFITKQMEIQKLSPLKKFIMTEDL